MPRVGLIRAIGGGIFALGFVFICLFGIVKRTDNPAFTLLVFYLLSQISFVLGAYLAVGYPNRLRKKSTEDFFRNKYGDSSS